MFSPANRHLIKLTKAHERSTLSHREVARPCGLDPGYVHYSLKKARRLQ